MRTWFGLKTTVKIEGKPMLDPEEIAEALANEGSGRPMKALIELLDQAILDRTSAAIDDSLPDNATKFYLGGAAALADFKEQLEFHTRPRP